MSSCELCAAPCRASQRLIHLTNFTSFVTPSPEVSGRVPPSICAGESQAAVLGEPARVRGGLRAVMERAWPGGDRDRRVRALESVEVPTHVKGRAQRERRRAIFELCRSSAGVP